MLEILNDTTFSDLKSRIFVSLERFTGQMITADKESKEIETNILNFSHVEFAICSKHSILSKLMKKVLFAHPVLHLIPLNSQFYVFINVLLNSFYLTQRKK